MSETTTVGAIDIEQLLVPVPGDNPCGEFLKLDSTYADIQQARRADDPQLPVGDWERTLKVADWQAVSDLSMAALEGQSKDLQLAIWLLEARIHLEGFAGISPAVDLISAMVERYWDNLYPSIDDGDVEYRTNLFAWMNEKLRPAIARIPLTLTANDHRFCWSDWERSAYHEQLGSEAEVDPDVLPLSVLNAAIVATPISFYRTLHVEMNLAVDSIRRLEQLLDDNLGGDAPSLADLRESIEDIRDALVSQVGGRGISAAPAEESDSSDEADEDSGGGGQSGGGDGSAGIANRDQAYAQLASAAEFLMNDDPHSPVPYLVYKAIDWGQLNTAELYQELFVNFQGNLNLFELLGIDIQGRRQ